jgi:formate--tetrahydrofolate ligase
MAVFCLASSLSDLRERLGRIIIGRTFDRRRVTAAEIGVDGAMTALLRDAFSPNLVQTLENNPAFVHGGPFANIAHGCNSLVATRMALKLADIVVTEAGFGADLGAEKFFDIKCRLGGLRPDAAVIVATLRALKLQGGAPEKEVNEPAPKTLTRGLKNLAKHIETVTAFGVPVVVAINAFITDTEEELAQVEAEVGEMGVHVVRADHWARGGEGAEALATCVAGVLEEEPADFQPLYPDDAPLLDKVRAIVQKVYGAEDIVADTKLRSRFRKLDEEGFGKLPVCMAKTQYSLSTDPNLKGRPKGFHVPLREVRVSHGAGFVLVLCGDIMTMPGLPRVPAAESIDVNADGQIIGLF